MVEPTKSIQTQEAGGEDQPATQNGVNHSAPPKIGLGQAQSVGTVEASGEESPKIVTPEKLLCYEKFKSVPILIEGPEQSNDYSYFLVDKNEDLKFLESGVPLEDFVDMREKRKFEMEFRVLQRMTQHKGHVKNLFNSPQMQFKLQNRYNEVLPFQHSRVVFKNIPCEQTASTTAATGSATDPDIQTYINANYINVFLQTFIRGLGEKAFIATQAPIDGTIEKFWQMIWEQNAKLIIMLCPVQGPKKEESTMYWASEEQKTRVFQTESFSLTLLSERNMTPGIVKRKFSLQNLKAEGEPPHTIVHLQNTRWEDDEALADNDHFEDIDNLVKKIKKYRSSRIQEGVKPDPVVVHCSAGIGRTGTLVAIYAIVESIEKLLEDQESLSALDIDSQILEDYPLCRKPRVSVFGAVRKMREQRWNMVKKQIQYSFIYDYIERWIRKNYIDLVLFNKDDFGDLSGKHAQLTPEKQDF